MTAEQLISEIEEAFGSSPRPAMFIRGTCSCEECMEHEAEMQSLAADGLPLEKLNNPGWDPLCFASNEALAYFMPGLARLVLEHADEYVQQFLFHMAQPERCEAYTPEQAVALLHLLDYLVLHEARALDHNLAVDALMMTREKLKQRTEGTTLSP